MSDQFSDIGVNVKVKADTKELRAAIKDFDGTAESIERLKTATASVKQNVDVQAKAVAALRREERVRNFETLEGIRVLRSFSSLASNLNQIYQTLILKQIQQNQVTTQQKEAFRQLNDKTDNLVNALDILGPKNQEVKKGFDDLISSASDLSSKDLQTLINKLELLKSTGKLSTEEMGYLNEKIKTLKEVMKDAIQKEDAQRIQDVFGTLITASGAASQLGTFAVNLRKDKEALSGMVSFVKGAAPELAIIMTLLYGKETAEALGLIKYAGGGGDTFGGKIPAEEDIIANQDKIQVPDISSRFGEGAINKRLSDIYKSQGKVLYVDMTGSLIVSPEQVKKAIDEAAAEFRRKFGDEK